jgi:hypothetical protein
MRCPNPPAGRRRRAPYLVWFAAAGLAAAGCGRGPQWAAVEGTVTVDGQPVSNIEVVFVPDPARGSNGPRAAALTDEQGHYRLHGDKGEEGAVVGQHRVLIVDNATRSRFGRPAPAAPAGGDDPAPVRPRPAPASKSGRIPLRFGSLTDTPLQGVEVKRGTQRHDFDVRTNSKGAS